MSALINLNEGNTNAYVIHGTLASLVSLPFAILFPFFGIPLLILALCIFATTNGLEIDTEARRYRKYGSFFAYKFGTWLPIGNPERAELVLCTEQSVATVESSMGGRPQTRARTFDIVLHMNSKKEITVYEFLNYAQGKEALAVFESLEIPVHNRIQEKIAERKAR